MGATTLEPGQKSFVGIAPSMHADMGGAHLFEITVETDSPTKTVYKLSYRAFFGDGQDGSAR